MRTGRLRTGYGMIQRDIMTMEGVSALSKSVYCLLVAYAGEKSTCFPSIVTICDNLELSKPTVIKCIKELEISELVVVCKVKSKDGFRSNVYEPLFLLQEDTLVKEVYLGSKGDLPSQVKEVYPKNNNIKNNIEEDLNINADLKKSAKHEDESISVKTKKEKKVQKVGVLSEEVTKELYNLVKKHFIEFYQEFYKTNYYFLPKDAAKVYSLIRKVEFKMKEKDGRDDFTLQELTYAANFFIEAAYHSADNWLKSNFNLSNIDSKFNEIYTKLKSNGKSSAKQTAAQQTRDNVVERFGSRFNR